MKILLKIFLFTLLPLFSDAQQNLPDSLRKIFLSSKDDSVLYQAANHLYDYYEELYRDSVFVYAEQSVLISRRNNKKLLIVKTSRNPPLGGRRAEVVISVIDNGNGIPQKILDKIFQPFFTTKPTGQGTGLGLSLSYDIVKAHGGEIKVNTKENEGTEFTISLPA